MAKQKTQRLKPRLKSLRRFRKLSDLMEVAIKDLRLVERQKKTYRIWMGDWHEPKSDGKCAVCLAGSVMAKTMHIPSEVYAVPGCAILSQGDSERLKAVNESRTGSIYSALSSMAMADVLYADKRADVYGSSAQERRDAVKWYAGLKARNDYWKLIDECREFVASFGDTFPDYDEPTQRKDFFKAMRWFIKTLRKYGV